MPIITRKVEQSLGVTVTNRLLGPNWFTAALTSKQSLALMSVERSVFEFSLGVIDQGRLGIDRGATDTVHANEELTSK